MTICRYFDTVANALIVARRIVLTLHTACEMPCTLCPYVDTLIRNFDALLSIAGIDADRRRRVKVTIANCLARYCATRDARFLKAIENLVFWAISKLRTELWKNLYLGTQPRPSFPRVM